MWRTTDEDGNRNPLQFKSEKNDNIQSEPDMYAITENDKFESVNQMSLHCM
jgi:hypothetical protein